MKNIFKYLVAGACVAFTLASCDKWTETEPVKVVYKDLKDNNPELWAKYLESIRNYHNTDHQVLIAKFDNKSTNPEGRGDHINCLPDSVDYVILNNADNLSASVIADAAEIKEQKAVPTLMNLDYTAFEAEYNNILVAETEQKEAEWNALSDEEKAERQAEFDADTRGVDSPERYAAWVGERTDAELAIVSKYAQVYDGINFMFIGVNPASLNDAAKEDVTIRQSAFFAKVNAWIDANPQALVFFEGQPKNILVPTQLLQKAKYIIIPSESATSAQTFSYNVLQSIVEGVPTDRFVIGVTAVDITDDTNTNGTFGSISAIEGAAVWNVESSSGYVRKGVCVNHAQFDYYDITNVYSQINKAISIMNPSPVK